MHCVDNFGVYPDSRTRPVIVEAGRGVRRHHHWTDAEREYIRVHYKHTHQSRCEIARALGVSDGAIGGQVAIMGLAKRTGRRPWNPEEDEKLMALAQKHCPRSIARKMGRSLNSVVVHMQRLGILRRYRDGWYTKKDVCEIFGVDHKRVQSWIDVGRLKASWHHERQPSKHGQGAWHIEAKDLKNFIRRYPEELNGRNVDIIQIVDILAGLKVSLRGRPVSSPKPRPGAQAERPSQPV